MISVVLVDDDALVIAGLRMLLAGDADIDVVGAADDGDRLVDLVDELDPDVVLLDVRMPRLDGVSALRALRARPGRQPAVLMLTTFHAEPVVLDAIRAGASGFLLKHTPPERIVSAVHAAAVGEVSVSPDVLRQLIGVVAAAGESVIAADPLTGLTDREREVAHAVSDGLSNGDIAARLFLSAGSVKAYISSALGKLGLENRVQLAIAAHESARVITGDSARSD